MISVRVMSHSPSTKNTTHLQSMPPDINIASVYETCTAPRDCQNRYRIRLMNQNDIVPVVAIERDTWGDASWSPEEFYQVLRDPLYHCWILDSITTDYVVLGYGIQCRTNDGSHIVNFCLHPLRRGRGLGHILLRHMIDHTRDNHGSTIELKVSTSNTPAYMLYVKHGFEVVDYFAHYYSEHSHAYKMALHF